MNDTLAGQVEQLVTERTGLKLRPRQRDALLATLARRVSELGLSGESDYFEVLRGTTASSEMEWQYLARLLTNKESYFFRDKGQIALLRDVILPELIHRNKSTETLRLWSAGCSTGEEAYTLAILVDELLRALQLRNWKVTIVGSDIDFKALQHARRGIYGSWSFRALDAGVKERWFRATDGGWQVLEPLRSSVVFLHSNLVADPFPNVVAGICEMDLIVCRNVFIYFEPRAVTGVLDKFARTLSTAGYLMTGHIETQGASLAAFQTRRFSESEIYQKGESSPKSNLPDVRPRPVRVVPTGAPPIVFKKVTQPPVAGLPEAAEPQDAIKPEVALLTQARNLADSGRYEEAVECCRALNARFPFSAEPYELLASIAQERGQMEEARTLLKRAIYLAPDAPHLYIELAALYHGDGDGAQAHKMHSAALDLLRQMPPEGIVSRGAGTTARECIQHLTETSGEGA